MLVIPGSRGKDTCDGIDRRDLLRVGGSGLLGLTLGEILGLQQQASANPTASAPSGGPGFGKAKSVIMVYLQGGPSHLDLWDPKDNVPDKVKSIFKPISTKLTGVQVTELLPKVASILDRTTLIRSMSYSPIGLFNHTAAIYQMMTGYTTDKVSPSGQLEPPTPKDFPNFGSNIIRLKPPTEPMLPFVMMPRPLQESNVVGKGGTAGFLGREYDPYTLYPNGDDMDMDKMSRIRTDDLLLRPEVSSQRLTRRASLRETLAKGMANIDQATAKYDLNAYYGKALGLVLSGKAREAFNLSSEKPELRDRYGRNTFGQSCLLARRLVEAGTRVVEVIWPKVANSDNHSWDVHTGLSQRMKNQAAPMLDAGLSSLIADLDERGLLSETLVVAVGEFGRSPVRGVSTSGNGNSDDGRDHWPYCYTAMIAGAGVKRGFVYGKSDKTASAPLENPVHPMELLATIYHSIGIQPTTIVYNHLNQPRELVKAEAISPILA
ncbi:DUF1501 domain-containing protein [Tuwongella immobilis]|uniref:DUF1501 domain-containing protein n=1 Tax=Tuwongella immobilis TaxID=692036 RepID=A0A6C2YNF1_9BACT|nr:DUF1501 domain-containing protein [Tuwongella immobilis]VIP02729.1 protein containing duf1501 : Uncharacterized protein OS=Singulisphaera acidiphila (strain ATCC BAA-1392 / DSM 18658 / VKM B-2454 / MOB10) GN=Sinac_4637 PE=4 SV=1: DUF1501 [Tuwongella immobilis]VTS02278.1 protein containing duf1501 : Uncharacterized protein OS=Singulisphaera acidiphila (strain ATCC BAA-1392 / DSM 18658 / VKM B-2454 / MOB10) GN=Sinac_4637 PE=4 SV=1: DUF1501 [Tuwongella immobilis]